MSGSNILFVLSGSIACMKACEAISQLVQRGHQVRTVVTPSALQFVGPATLEGLTGQPPLTDTFATGAAMEHVKLTRWADAVVVCPATAGILNRFAAGLSDDLPGALYLAHDRTRPWLAFPAMNPAMWSHPATRRAVAQLKADGIQIQEVGSGRVACGEIGEGRLLEPLVIVSAIERALVRPSRALRVLITSGGTSEPVDGVRVLTNTSTGSTGALIADHFVRAGHGVTLLRARNALRPEMPCVEEVYSSFAELDVGLERILGGNPFDAIIHAAAVSDFSVDSVRVEGRVVPAGSGKIESSAAPVIALRPNPKLIATLAARSRVPTTIVAFKLTRGATAEEVQSAVQRVGNHEGVEYVVHNDLEDRAEGGDFPAAILNPQAGLVERCHSRRELAAALERLIVAKAEKGDSV